MIIDCHGHYTTMPAPVYTFREAQLARLEDANLPAVPPLEVGDDEIRESVEGNQLQILRDRGADLTIFSPRASFMEHHVEDRDTAVTWARTSNDLIHRVVGLFPDNFAAACQLPQTPTGPISDSVEELRRCVTELGFVGCLLNPDPSGGSFSAPPVTDPYWFPLYEAMVELDVPAMIHVSQSCNPNVHFTGAYYLNADTTVFMQLVEGDLFKEFPTLRFVIPHGGGAVPYHWGRYQGIANRIGSPPVEEHVMDNVFFDTCVYHQAGIDLLLRVVNPGNVLFGSEMLGAVRGADPATGIPYDDTRRYVDASALSGDDKRRVFEENARRVYPRLDAQLKAREASR
jgi:4-oxalmesaconate hydratase